MSITSGIVVYIVVWWMVFLASLSFGIEVPEKQKKGHATSAPKDPLILKKAIITTIISFVVWYAIDRIIDASVFNLRPTQIP